MEFLSRHLDFQRWGFNTSFTDFKKSDPYAVFDSPWCRVSFRLEEDRSPQSTALFVLYGRMHAIPAEELIVWNGQKCYCWHQILEALAFLDGLSPQEAVDTIFNKRCYPPVAETYRQSEIGQKNLAESLPQFTVGLHGFLWQHYGKRLFEIFDLRRPDLWERYSRYVREFFRIRPLLGDPPTDHIC
jgi:hypothetical protein